MSILWDVIRKGRQSAGNAVEWVGGKLGIPETGISEAIAGGPTKKSGQVYAFSEQGYQPPSPEVQDAVRNYVAWKNSSKLNYTPAPASNPKPAPTNTGQRTGGGGGGAPDLSNPVKKTEYAKSKGYDSWDQYLAAVNNQVNSSAEEQRRQAEAAREARRRAAMAKWEAMKGIAERAKKGARETYDWLVDTLGSNKKNLLEQVALQERTGLKDYQFQEEKTRRDYDKAKQQILSTYRDLQRQQEKIMRGAGMSSSSRAQEAALKLNRLLGKDISQVRTNEADSLAMIGNALQKFKDNIRNTRLAIEREAKTKLDKAALDFKRQIDAINNNLTLSEAEREEAYAQAEAQLAQDTQAIQQWATGIKTQAELAHAKMKEQLDSLIADMLDEKSGLNTSLQAKRDATSKVLQAMGYTPLDENPDDLQDPTVGVYRARMTYKDKDALDRALQNGEITPQDYDLQLKQIMMGTGGATAKPQPDAATRLSLNTASVNPLTRVLFG